ncbi:hypothetical protein [Jeotgalibacillus salarius]|uniref:Swarming motility protein SwrB n=1 Tax=Jeotgalibacillus salarius TaxID=546023 RepID=A0A4Y8LID8_9BACL|nr:hypothetical protein [Jeotgalibacillus salarius]TFE02784.1 hypothetical protein E2626_02985 [Jeotgalibacillus salarius]
MILFLLILSIIFNIAAFLSIYLLFMRQNRLISKEVQHERTLNEIEQTFTGYLLEMKEENEHFLKQFEKISKTTAKPADGDPDKTEEPGLTAKTTRNMATAAYKKPAGKPRSVSDQAKDLKSKGYTVEEIAKQLKKGKTEIELMLKFKQS